METFEEAKSYIRFLYEQLQEMKSELADLKTLLEEVRLDLKEARKQIEKKHESESTFYGCLKNCPIVNLTFVNCPYAASFPI